MSYFEKLRLRELRRGSELLRALKGRKIVAGGNAPGKRVIRLPTLKGSHYLGPQDAKPVRYHPDSTLSGSDLVVGTFSGGVAPGYYIAPLRGATTDSPAPQAPWSAAARLPPFSNRRSSRPWLRREGKAVAGATAVQGGLRPLV